MLIDYNCRLFEINKFELIDSSLSDHVSVEMENIKSDLTMMANAGFHTFFCHVCHNENLSVTVTNKKISFMKTLAKMAIPKECGKISVRFVPKVFLTKDVPYINRISSLALGSSNYIFLELPLIGDYSYIPEALNKILYNCRLIPIFTEFKAISALYPYSEVEKMIRIKNAAFQINIKALADEKIFRIINKILANGNTVLFGTNSSHSTLNIKEIVCNIEKFRKHISDESYRNIVISARNFFN